MGKIYLLCFILFATAANAAVGMLEFKSTQMEADYLKLINELRCLVCQNQNLAESNAGLARDLRTQTYDMLIQGNTPEQVVDYMVARYGDFVLYRPRLKRSTVLLWFGPFILLVLVLVLVIRSTRRKQTLEPPDGESMKRAGQILSNTEDKT